MDGPFGDIQDKRLLYAKGLLFLLTGCLAAGLLLAEHPSWKVAGLLALAIWSFARSYYFAFYVIEHYADPGYRFAGLWDFAKYVLRRRSKLPDASPPMTHPARASAAEADDRPHPDQ